MIEPRKWDACTLGRCAYRPFRHNITMHNTKVPGRRSVVLRCEPLESRQLMSVSTAAPHALESAGTAAPLHTSMLHATLLDVGRDWGLTGAGQTVAVIDSGIAYDHFALGGGLGANHRVVGGWDFAENDANPYDDGPLGFHGTHIAGIIGSQDPAHRGLAPQVDLVGLRVFDDHGDSDFDWIEQALWWVHEHRNDFEFPITTINLSLGGDWNDDEVPDWGQLEDAFAALKQDGIVIAASAGNDFSTGTANVGLSYPAASPSVIPVASVDAHGQLSDFTQRHPRVLATLGEDIMSTVPDYLFGFDGVTDDYLSISGTSVAAPFVAGAAVLLREALAQAQPGRPVNQDVILNILQETADPIYDPITHQTYRRMNLPQAVASILNSAPAPLPVVWLQPTQTVLHVPAGTTPATYNWTSTRTGWYQISLEPATNPHGLPAVYRGESADEIGDGLRIGTDTLVFYAERGEAIRLRFPSRDAQTSIQLARIAEFENGMLTLRGDLAQRPLAVLIGATTIHRAIGPDLQSAIRPWLATYQRLHITLNTALGSDGFMQLSVQAIPLATPRSSTPRSPRAAPVTTPSIGFAATDAVFAAPAPIALRAKIIDAAMRRR